MKVTRIIFIIWVLAIVPVAYVRAQQRGNSDRATNDKTTVPDSEYQFRLGERLRASFIDNCLLLMGVTGSVEDQRFELGVQERLWGDSEIGAEKLSLSLPSGNSRNSVNSPWEKASAEPGRQLITGVCGANSDRFRIVVSNERYFASIRNVIAFENQLRQNKSAILDMPVILATQDDSILAGYAISVLSGSVENKDEAALVLIQILEDRSVPPLGLALARIKLRQILIKGGSRRLSANTGRAVLEKMVKAAGQIGASDQVFILMSELADQNRLDIREFVTPQNRAQIKANYDAFLKANQHFKPHILIQQQIYGH